MRSRCRYALVAKAISEYAADVLGATDISAGVSHGNTKSVAVLERAGLESPQSSTTTRGSTSLCLRVASAAIVIQVVPRSRGRPLTVGGLA
jgi:hypothetical protein